MGFLGWEINKFTTRIQEIFKNIRKFSEKNSGESGSILNVQGNFQKSLKKFRH
jgi:hypothetical protein